MSGVTLPIFFRRSIDDFVTVSIDAANSYSKIIEADLYVRKMTLNDDVVSAIEKVYYQLQRPICILETLTKRFSLPLACKAGNRRRVPIRRLSISLNTKEASLGSKQLNPFLFVNSKSNRFVFTELGFLLQTVQ